MKKFSRKYLETRIKSIIKEVTGYDEALLTKDTPLTPDENSDHVLSVGSLEFAELIITLEEAFNVQIPDEAVSNFKIVGDLVDYVAEHIS